MNIQSWQIFHTAKKKLPPGVLHGIFRRSVRLVTYWAADPRYCDEVRRNPLDRIRDLLEALDLAGAGEYARAAIDYMAEPLGGRFTDRATARSDKGSVDGEAADALVSLGELTARARQARETEPMNGEARVRIVNAARDVRREIEQLLDAALGETED